MGELLDYLGFKGGVYLLFEVVIENARGGESRDGSAIEAGVLAVGEISHV